MRSRALVAERKFVTTARADTPVPREWFQAPTVFRHHGRRVMFRRRNLHTILPRQRLPAALATARGHAAASGGQVISQSVQLFESFEETMVKMPREGVSRVHDWRGRLPGILCALALMVAARKHYPPAVVPEYCWRLE